MNLIAGLMLVMVSSGKVNLFQADSHTLLKGGEVIASVPKGDVFISPDGNYAAVYDQSKHELVFLGSSSARRYSVEALNPIVKIDEAGYMAVFEPEISRFRVFDRDGKQVVSFKPADANYTDEAYEAFDVSENAAALALYRNGATTLSVWKFREKAHQTARIEGLYPAELWISPDNTVYLRVYRVENGQFAMDRLLIYPDGVSEPDTLSLHGVREMDFGRGVAFAASRHTVYRIKSNMAVDSAIVSTYIVDLRADGRDCWLLTASPSWDEKGFYWHNPTVYLWSEDGIREVGRFNGMSQNMSLVRVDGKIKAWLADRGDFIGEASR